MKMINTSDYNLIDSDTGSILSIDDLRCTTAEFDEAIRESVDSEQPEGHVRIGGVGRRVYAQVV